MRAGPQKPGAKPTPMPDRPAPSLWAKKVEEIKALADPEARVAAWTGLNKELTGWISHGAKRKGTSGAIFDLRAVQADVAEHLKMDSFVVTKAQVAARDEQQAKERQAKTAETTARELASFNEGVAWKPYSRAAVEAQRKAVAAGGISAESALAQLKESPEGAVDAAARQSAIDSAHGFKGTRADRVTATKVDAERRRREDQQRADRVREESRALAEGRRGEARITANIEAVRRDAAQHTKPLLDTYSDEDLEAMKARNLGPDLEAYIDEEMAKPARKAKRLSAWLRANPGATPEAKAAKAAEIRGR